MWGTLETSLTAIESAARPWVEDRVDELVLDGDFNFDGVVDGVDFEVWSGQSGYSGPFPFEGSYADGNRDGVVNDADRAIWEANVPCNPNTQGDFDGSGMVDFGDFLVLSRNFGQAVTSHLEGDIDCSGTVNFSDFLAFSQNFGNQTAESASVPEPSGKALMILGFVSVLLRMRSE